nr:O-antigen polysaccharide polymerase Wzy [Microbacterium testaceum]
MYAALRLAVIFWSAERRPFVSVFYTFVYITMGVVPLAQYLLDREQYYSVGINPIMSSAIILVGCFSFDLGYVAHRRRKTPASDAKIAENNVEAGIAMSEGTRILRAVSIASLIIAAYYVASAGGPASFFSSRQDLGIATAESFSSDGGESTRAVVASLAKVGPLFALLTYVFLWRHKRMRFRIPDGLLMWGLLAVNILVNNPISNPRYWFLAVLLGAFFTAARSKVGQDIAIVAGIIAAIVVFPVSDVTRYANPQDAISYGSIWETIAVKDYDQFTMINNSISFTSDVGFSVGRQLLGVLLFWVPRSIWPDKPLDSGVVLGEWLSMRNTNLSSPLWTEGWMNFGWIGVVVFLLVLGLIGSRLDSTYAAGLRNPLGAQVGTHVGTALLAGYLFIILRGPLLQASARLIVILVFVAILNLAFRNRMMTKFPGSPQ